MITVTSASGGKTSAYIVANYPQDHVVFALVRIEDKKCLFPDKKIRKEVEDRIQKPFIATAEDDEIIYTMLDLEQFTGKKINWVSGITFDEVVRKKGGWLPNKLHRYCTTHLKLEPIFYWWAEIIKEPCIMQIGFRANENRRAHQMLERTNENGLLEMKATFSKHANGNNRWEMVEWQKPEYPLIAAGIFKDNVENYWKDKPVRFARLNNCVGCFHRNPLLLKKQFEAHPGKMNWFKNQEGGKNGYWRNDTFYERIENHKLQIEINFDDFSECDSGYCGI